MEKWMDGMDSRYLPRTLLRFEVQVAEHCNLSCRDCYHYSPIAEEEFLDLEEYSRDCRRLSELFDGEVEWIHLMGGEPLLNPELAEIMRITRENFPFGDIMIVTNGILLPRMEEDFWKACGDYRVSVNPTKYPLNIDYEGPRRKAEEFKVRYSYYNEGQPVKTMDCHPLNVEGNENVEYNFYHCPEANGCITLSHGRLYTCVFPAHAHHLNRYFGLNLPLSKRNGVSIYEVDSAEELMRRLTRPIPFCRFCDLDAHLRRLPFGVSSRDRCEWMTFTFDQRAAGELSRYSRLYLYGAGDWGRKAVQRLREIGAAIESIIVTDGTQNPASLMGIPVREIGGMDEADPDSVCLIAIRDHDVKSEIYGVLSRKGFRHIIPLFDLE